MTDIMTQYPASGWKMYRLGQLFDERREKVSDKDFPPLSVTMNGIVPQLDSAAKSDDGDNRKLVRVGDYVINSRSDRKGSGGISVYDGSVSLISIVLEPTRIEPAFAHHLLRSAAFQEEFYRWGHGIVADLWTTRYSDMKNIRLYLPDLTTQRQIADFLDRETARIDLLIEKKQRMVALLGEKQQTQMEAIVFNPSFKLKKLRHMSQVISKGTTPSTIGEEITSSGVRYLKAENITLSGVSAFPENYISEETHAIMRRSALRADDVLVVIAGATTGKTAILPEQFAPSNTNQAVSFVRLIDTRYAIIVAAAMKTRRIQIEVSLTSVQSAQPNLSMENLGNLRMPVPNVSEIEDVSRRLAQADAEHQTLVSQVLESITRLREYRSALITAAVTGQIDPATRSAAGTNDRQLDALQNGSAP